ncbi:hypothetical protein NBRC3280_2739 [Acetobacter pasteurianus NBRC 3280]|nr:hypothetical protein NBRC3277_2737 [Acetobacter pasteurianus NBRC 3277]GCD70104.1 hypothetical protein NBRC3280_2739 [Acetobacter pasteurianus NBRC 3280]
MQGLHAPHGLAPVGAALLFARDGALRLAERTHGLLPEVARRDGLAITHGGEHGHAHVDPDRRQARRDRPFYFALPLDRREPLPSPPGQGDVADHTGQSVPAPESNPSEFGELDAPGLLSGPLYTQRGRIGKTETVVQALSTGRWIARPPGEEALIGAVEIAQGLL